MSDLEDTMLFHIRAAGLPEPIREFRFAKRYGCRNAANANVRTCPPWPVVTLPEDEQSHDPRAVIRARLRAVREKWGMAS